MMNYSHYTDNKDPIVAILLSKLFDYLDEITNKDYVVEKKSNSLHIVKGSAFLGVHFLKTVLRINIVLDHKLDIDLPTKVDRPSKNIFHNKVDLSSIEDLISVRKYIKEAYLRKKTLQ